MFQNFAMETRDLNLLSMCCQTGGNSGGDTEENVDEKIVAGITARGNSD